MFRRTLTLAQGTLELPRFGKAEEADIYTLGLVFTHDDGTSMTNEPTFAAIGDKTDNIEVRLSYRITCAARRSARWSLKFRATQRQLAPLQAHWAPVYRERPASLSTLAMVR